MSELEAWEVRFLASIGLEQPDPRDPLHSQLVNAIRRLGPGSRHGDRLQACRWVFAHVLRTAAEEEAIASVDFEHHVNRRTVLLRAEAMQTGVKLSRLEAEQIASQEDAAYQAHLKRDLAKARASSMRKFLDAIDSAIELHRTDRADERKADFAHSEGIGGGA